MSFSVFIIIKSDCKIGKIRLYLPNINLPNLQIPQYFCQTLNPDFLAIFPTEFDHTKTANGSKIHPFTVLILSESAHNIGGFLNLAKSARNLPTINKFLPAILQSDLIIINTEKFSELR